MKWWHYCLVVIACIALLAICFGCSHAASDLERKQRAIQDCLLSGGRARLGPGNTILCD